MQHYFCFKTIDHKLYNICSDISVFEGLPVIMGRDLARILPVIC